MKKWLMATILAVLCTVGVSTDLQADAIIVDLGAESKHLIEGDFNEKHSWVGVGYRFIERDKYSVQVKYVDFVNSYADSTQFAAITGIYTPIKYKGIKLGLAGSIGYQKGYFVDSTGTYTASQGEKLGLDNRSILLLYSFYAELDNLIINYTYIPNAVKAVTVGVKVVEW